MIVITDISREPPVQGDLFAGKKFWIAQRCPSRQDFIKRVTYNGGSIVPLEKQADYLIVDHARHDLPPGGISYRFIEQSIRHQELQDPSEHVCGPPVGSVREIGSKRPTRPGRTQFTPQDDIELYNWVKNCERNGVKVKGNEIYKQLEQKNPRHPFQSWRDRYVKYLSIKPPKTVGANPPPSPPSDPQPAPSPERTEHAKKPARVYVEARPSPSSTRKRGSPSQPRAQSPTYAPEEPPETNPPMPQVSLELFDSLLAGAETVLEVRDDLKEKAWVSFATRYPSHTADQWQDFFYNIVEPIYDDQKDNKAKAELYDRAFEEWSKKHENTSVRQWLDFYREKVLPKLQVLGPSAKDQNEHGEAQAKIEERAETDAAEENHASIPKTSDVNAGRQAQDSASLATQQPAEDAALDFVAEDLSKHATPINGSFSQIDLFKTETPSNLGKRLREHVALEREDPIATPTSAKRRNTGSRVSFQSAQESIEVSPTKKSLESPARAAEEVISITSSIAESSPFPEDTPEPQTQYDYSQPEGAEDESRDSEDDEDSFGPSVSEEQIRKVLHGLDDEAANELLAVLRRLPAARDEPDDMDPQEALIMHTLNFFTQVERAESQAVWDVGDVFERLGLMDKFNDADEASEGGEAENAELQLHVDPEQGDTMFEEEVEEAEDAAGHPDPEPEPDHQSPPPQQQYDVETAASESFSQIQNHPKPQKQHPRPASSATTTTFELSSEVAFDLNTEAEAEAYISSRSAPPYAFPVEDILTALHVTCANSTTLADTVLRWMRTNSDNNSKKRRRSSINVSTKNLPDMPGVWTSDDDRALRDGTPTAERKKIERKHGRERCRRRRDFLAELGM